MVAKNTLVLGASLNPQRYSYLAMHKLTTHGHSVVAIGKKAGLINNIAIVTDKPSFKDIDTVTLYLNPANQIPYYDYIISLHPKRIIFNPGTENDELEALARKNGIKTLQACTLVMLSTNQY